MGERRWDDVIRSPSWMINHLRLRHKPHHSNLTRLTIERRLRFFPHSPKKIAHSETKQERKNCSATERNSRRPSDCYRFHVNFESAIEICLIHSCDLWKRCRGYELQQCEYAVRYRCVIVTVIDVWENITYMFVWQLCGNSHRVWDLGETSCRVRLG